MLNSTALWKQYKSRRVTQAHPQRTQMRRIGSSSSAEPRRSLCEGQELTSFIDVLNAASQYLGEKKNDSSSLPADSPERLMVEAIDGLLHKYSLNKEQNPANETIRQKITGLTTALDEHLENQSSGSDFIEYLKKLKEGLLELHNNIDPDGQEDPEPGLEQQGEGVPEAGAEGAPPQENQEEEQPEDEVSSLSRQLGLNDHDQPIR